MVRFDVRFVSLLLLTALAAPARAGDVSVRLDAGSGFSLKNGTGAIERLRVDEATGNLSRNGALFVHTTGTSSTFVGVGAGSLSTTGARNSAFGQDVLLSNTTGGYNTAVANDALRANTTGNWNSAVGFRALRDNTTGSENSAFGSFALVLNTTASSNSAFGVLALGSNTTGMYNTAVGVAALLENTTGFSSAAIGGDALRNNTTGNRNAALGKDAGVNQTTGSDNIYLANTGVAGESGRIKIGTVGTHTQTQIAGIHGATSGGGIAVLVNASGTLGTTTSSARFKEDVEDMGDASDLLMRLRPVAFRYREEAVGAEESRVEQYGLIAEEVAEVAPELVAPDLEGKPYSVKYHVLPALLLGEAQEQHRINEEQKQVIAALSARLAALEGAPAAACDPEGR